MQIAIHGDILQFNLFVYDLKSLQRNFKAVKYLKGNIHYMYAPQKALVKSTELACVILTLEWNTYDRVWYAVQAANCNETDLCISSELSRNRCN